MSTSRLLALARIPVADKVETARTLALSLAVEVAIRVAPIPKVAGGLGIALDFTIPTPALPAVVPTPPLTSDEARRVRSVRRVMRHWPFGRGTCLRQSLVLGHLLRHRHPVLRLGVRSRHDGVIGHAWLELSGTSVGGDTSFLPLLSGFPDADAASTSAEA